MNSRQEFMRRKRAYLRKYPKPRAPPPGMMFNIFPLKSGNDPLVLVSEVEHAARSTFAWFDNLSPEERDFVRRKGTTAYFERKRSSQ